LSSFAASCIASTHSNELEFPSKLYDMLTLRIERPERRPSKILVPPNEVIRFQLRSRISNDIVCSKYSPSTIELKSPIMFLLKFSSFKSGLDDLRPRHKVSSSSSLSLLLLKFSTFSLDFPERDPLVNHEHIIVTVFPFTKLFDRSNFSHCSLRL